MLATGIWFAVHTTLSSTSDLDTAVVQYAAYAQNQHIHCEGVGMHRHEQGRAVQDAVVNSRLQGMYKHVVKGLRRLVVMVVLVEMLVHQPV